MGQEYLAKLELEDEIKQTCKRLTLIVTQAKGF